MGYTDSDKYTDVRNLGGISSEALKIWGLLFVLAGVIGRGILQNCILRVGTISGQELLETMNLYDGAMLMATVSLLLQALETCAVPIFAFALVEGARYTADWKKYLLRLTLLAVISEIPYNLAFGRLVLDLSSRNPVFGLVLGLILILLYRQFSEKKAVCILSAVAAASWVMMLRVEHGIPMLLIVSVIWIFREQPMLCRIMGAAAAAICTLGSLFYLASPMAFLAIHAYRGERGTGSRLIFYCFYPMILLAAVLVGMLL